MRKSIVVVALSMAVFVVATQSHETRADLSEQSISGTWRGFEDLEGYGRLSFTFHANGAATMYDKHGATQGSWSRSGNTITINVANCRYIGVLNGNELRGTGVFTRGPQQGFQWAFIVSQ